MTLILNSSTSVESKQAYRWMIQLQCCLIYFCFGIGNVLLSAITVPVMSDLALSYSQMGFVLGVWELAFMVVSLPIGFFIDRVGYYESLLIGTAMISASLFLTAFATNFAMLTAFTALFGIGGSIVAIGVPKVTSIWFSGRERGTAASLYFIGSTLGGIVTLSLTNSLVIPLVGNWRHAFLVYGFIVLLIGFIWLFFGHRSPSSGDPKVAIVPVKESLRGLREVFSRNVLLVVIIGITVLMVGHGVGQWLPTILQVNGMTPTDAGFAVSMVNVFNIFGTLLAPRLPYMVGSKRAAISILLLLQGLSVLTISGTGGPALWSVLALRGISGGFTPLLMVVLMDLPEVGPARMGIVGGLFWAVGQIGGFGGPSLMGLLKDITGTFSVGLIVIAVICEAMIIPAVFLKVEKKQNTAGK